MDTKDLIELVQSAWSSVPAPPGEDLRSMEWSFGEDAARAFVGVAPMDVDRRSGGFSVATPLVELPPRASASYLGTYLVSLLEGLDFQDRVGLFDDFLTRAHTLTCLTKAFFWEDVIRAELSPECQKAVEQVSVFLVSRKDDLPLEPEQVDTLLAMVK